jgi:hypothetical protein
MRLAIIGAGSVRCSVAVLASLATYFGERPLEIRLYDADEERLDLFDRLARHLFFVNRNSNALQATTDPDEALLDADRVVLQVDENCARKLIRQRMGSFPSVALQPSEVISMALEYLVERKLDQQADVLSLQREDVRVPLDYYFRLDWPQDISGQQRVSVPHQIMRWVREEEYVTDLLAEHEKTPLKDWLNDVNSAIKIDVAG